MKRGSGSTSGGSRRSPEHLGLAEVVSLEEIETVVDAPVELVLRLDLLGDDEHAG